MKANQYDDIRTSVEVFVEQFGITLPIGTRGTIVECYTKPREGYLVDLDIRNYQLHDPRVNVALYPEQFELDNPE